ncbi:hypothetical protein L6164_030968 [Bauhinia variegata]|uniref:Uncharacterized protein n=1 Tax=Bauhinia variegata TaxID=167791 RepID=A0ACB9LF97_BAUVA|nr:hypothetical protein L6164_030968 [Bauhinia variegata]
MLTGCAIASLPKLPAVKKGGPCAEKNNVTRSNIQKACLPCFPSNRSFGFDTSTRSAQPATIICAAALINCNQCKRSTTYGHLAMGCNARCGAEQTQTVPRQAPTMTHIPGKEKSPQLDDGGTGFPPGGDDDGGGGGGRGRGNWSSGFFFFGFLAFLGLLKDKESDGDYRDSRRR